MTAATYSELERLRDAVELHRMCQKKLHLPRPLADSVVRGVKFAVNPRQHRLRRRVAGEIAANRRSAQEIPRHAGFLRFEPGHFPDAPAALEHAHALFLACEADGIIEKTQQSAKKNFLLSIVKGEEFLAHPEVLRFMISRPVLDLASIYLETVPVLSAASLWWTPPNQSTRQSQLFHRDGEDTRQLKFFFNVSDVTSQAGPLTFLAADVSDKIRRKIGYNTGRLTDEAIDEAGGAGNYITLTGPRGSGAALDTSRCLHYGSRGNAVGRLILMFQFTSFYAPKAETPHWSGIGSDLDLDEVQKLALCLA